jgi:hypothetical protein
VSSLLSVGAGPWPPKVGEQLPRPDQVWFEQSKLNWILSSEGHGPEWTRVFRVDLGDRERVWLAIAGAMYGAAIKEVRDRSPFGISCGVEVDLTLNARSALTLVSWHYAIEIAAPRLVTAYPTP